MSTVVRGLGSILSGGADFITFEEGKPMTLLFVDWYEDLSGIREHYEKALNPSYVRCPGKEVCPLCAANPSKYPALRIKFRVYDPTVSKVKFVSLAKSHIQKLNSDFMLDEVDPTKRYVTIYRTGKGASDTSYSARAYVANPEMGRMEIPFPDFNVVEVPDIAQQLTPHTPEHILGIMQALISGGQATPDMGQGQGYPPQGQYAPQGSYAPQGGYPPQGGYAPQGQVPQGYAPQGQAPQYTPQQSFGGQAPQDQAPQFGGAPQGGYVPPQQQFGAPPQVPAPPQDMQAPPQGAPAQQRKLPF